LVWRALIARGGSFFLLTVRPPLMLAQIRCALRLVSDVNWAPQKIDRLEGEQDAIEFVLRIFQKVGTMKRTLIHGFILAIAVVSWPLRASAQQKTTDERVESLEHRVAQLESSVHETSGKIAYLDTSVSQKAGEGVLLVLFGAFCALWAQNTGRSAWLWFFMGLFFNVITLIVLLMKNSKDRTTRLQLTP
jgi:hypothetical protein